MAHSIPEDIVDKVRDSADIVEIVSEHLPLKHSGRNLKALCPFHPERTASFMVSPEKQIYHCFGCGAGGNVFNFLMQIENITFPEAVRTLGKRYGIKMPQMTSKVSSEASLAYKINAMAAKAYHAALSGTKEGTAARRYLRSRGVTEETEKEFLIGYAPSDGGYLVLEAKRRKVEPQQLLALGLAIERDGRPRDLFRNRLIFPIASAGGRILGFGGRVLDDAQPKYLNSPETRLFRKSETIFGLYKAKGELRGRGQAIVVEGYMDVIPLHAGGFRNTVASLGTAFTFEQARRIKRYCGEIVLAYDGDEAGRLAALRACDAGVQAGLKVRVVSLPDGKDPDSYLKAEGREALAELIKNASHYVDFALAQSPTDDLEDAVKFVLTIISKVEDPVRISLDIKRLAAASGISEVALQRSLVGISRRKPSGPPERKQENERKQDTTACDTIEKSIVSIMIGLPECVDRIFGAISPSDFTDRRMRKIAETILDRKSRGLAFDTSALLSVIDDEHARTLLIDTSIDTDITGDPDKLVSDHIAGMKRRVIERQIATLRKQIEIAEKDGDTDLLQALLTKRQGLAQDLRLLST
ncbi:MAG: DNA primase [Candidatus Eisenbacteria bacterium]